MAQINYQNLPSTSTPLNATNLNAMQEIEEIGSNTYGVYIKFINGNLIQMGSNEFTGVNITNQYGDSYYYALPGAIKFPMNFYDTSYGVVLSLNTSGVGSCNTFSKTTSQFSTKVFNGTSQSNATIIFSWIAYGRWKA